MKCTWCIVSFIKLLYTAKMYHKVAYIFLQNIKFENLNRKFYALITFFFVIEISLNFVSFSHGLMKTLLVTCQCSVF